MRIVYIESIGYRGLPDTKAELEPLSVIVGARGAGKTSFQDIIQFGLTGRSRWLNEKGDGREKLIAHGKTGAGVRLTLDSGLTILRQFSAKKYQITLGTEAPGGPESMQPKIEAALGVGGEAVLLSCDTDRFFDHTAKGQQKILLALAGAGSTTEEIKELLGEGLAARADELGAFAMDKFIGFEAAHDLAYTARTKANKRLAELKGELKGVQSNSTDPGMTPEQIQQAETKAEHQISLLLASQQAATREEEQRKTRERDKASVQKTINEADGEVQQVIDQINLLKSKQGTVATLQAKLAEAQEKEPELEAALEKAQRKLFSVSPEVVEALKAGGRCMALGCQCPHTKADIIKSLKARDKAATETQKEVEAAKKALDIVRKGTEEIRSQLAGLGDIEERVALLESKRQGIESSREEALRRLEEIRAEEAKEKPVSFDRKAWDAAQEEQKRVQRIKQALSNFIDAQGKLQILDEEIELQEVVCQELNALVEAFKPGAGIQAQILAESKVQVEARINGVLQSWGWSVSIDPAEQTILVNTGNGLTSWDLLSGGERLILGVAIQASVASKLGTRFFLVDLDVGLTQADRDALTGVCFALIESKTIDQVVMTSIISNGQIPYDPGVAGLGIYLADEHGITRRPAKLITAGAAA